MEEKEEVVNINFFKKVWYSISKFEQYPAMAAEGLWRAIKYLTTLTIIVTIFLMIGSLLKIKTLIGDFAKYVNDNIPEFTYSDGKLNIETKESIIIEDIEEIGINKIVINTLVETEEQKQELEENNLIDGITVFLLKDEIIFKTKLEDIENIRQTYTYDNVIENYLDENMDKFNKTEFVQFLTSEKMSTFYIQYAGFMFIYLLIINLIIALLDSFEIAILGVITSTMVRLRMRFVAIYNMAIYSLTLSMFLNVLYIIINYFTNFTITYFQVAYITIAYICLAATIFIIKDDFIKKMKEVEKIKQEQLKVREEIKEEQEKKEKEDKEEKSEKNEEDDPQGSEV